MGEGDGEEELRLVGEALEDFRLAMMCSWTRCRSWSKFIVVLVLLLSSQSSLLEKFCDIEHSADECPPLSAVAVDLQQD